MTNKLMILKKAQLVINALHSVVSNFNKKKFYNKIKRDFSQGILLYADVNLNIIDGSSLWLANIVALLGTYHPATPKILLLKNNIRRTTLLRSFKRDLNLQIIEPKDIYRVSNPLSVSEAVEIISLLDDYVGGFSSIVLRGFELCKLASAKNNLSKRLICYFTEIYKISKDQLLVRPNLANDLVNIRYASKGLLLQTQEIAEFLQPYFLSDLPTNIHYCPPLLPDSIVNYQHKTRHDNRINIVYAGKLAPQWGIIELFETFNQLKKQFDNLYLHVIGNKIHNSSEEFPNFKQNVLEYLQKTSNLIWHRGKSHEETLTLLQEMDVAWAYRDVFFENHTKEISCKLLEYFSIVPITLVTKNSIVAKTIGENYPYLITDAKQLFATTKIAIQNVIKNQFPTTTFKQEDYLEKTLYHTSLKFLLPNNDPKQKKNIVFAGHDFKFITHFISHLRDQGFTVKLDWWSHRTPKDINRSKQLLAWADIIFCEWCLGNAVWYSRSKLPHQRLFIRVHLQEVQESAIKYPKQVQLENVDKVLFVSSGIKNQAQNFCHWPAERLMVLSNYVETTRFFIPKEADSQFTLGLVGIVPQRKRLDRALDLLEALRKKDSRYKLIIKGKLPSDYSWMHVPSRANELNYYQTQFNRINQSPLLKDAVIFDAFDSNMAVWYRKIAYILSPSDFESFHYSIADGVSSGAFPIIWPWDEAENIYQKEWVIKDTVEAADKIVQLSQLNLEDKSRILERNRQFIIDNFSCEVIYEELKNLMLNSPKNHTISD